MTNPSAPRLIRGGLVLIDPASSAVQRIIALQYNPDTLTRTLQPQSIPDTGDRSEALRLKATIETIKLEAEIDAVDHWRSPIVIRTRSSLACFRRWPCLR